MKRQENAQRDRDKLTNAHRDRDKLTNATRDKDKQTARQTHPERPKQTDRQKDTHRGRLVDYRVLTPRQPRGYQSKTGRQTDREDLGGG